MVNELQGQELGGCELLEEIGQGGMGLIYRSKQLSLDRVVAMKILAGHLAHNPSFVERFQREARAIAKVNHPNILGVFDVGQQDGRHYMIMELVEGGSLAELLEKRGILDPYEAADFMIQAAEGLACAADQNIIHRDVKPDNIMLTLQHQVKVSDFGLAKELDSTMTETQAVMGTPAYMSPEQCDGRDLDSRTDIYSLGGTFYRCITGRLPFEADTAMSMMYRHKHVPLVPPNEIVPTLPRSFSDVICKMMAKDREERFGSLGEVAAAIEEAKSAKASFDPGRTVPVTMDQTMKLPAQGEEPDQEENDDRPAFLRTDSRVVSRPEQSPEEAADTRARCKEASRKLRSEGKLAQAARELRRLLEVAPDDEEAKSELREIEKMVGEKRQVTAEVRSLVASGQYEEALMKWNGLSEELRDEQIEQQMDRLARTVVPSLRQTELADKQASTGDLEEAFRLYEEALQLDPVNEKAKQGIKNVERTRQRIQILLKDGYEHRQNRDYGQAVQVWGKILEVDPNNAQARRLIVEARMAAAGEAYSGEQFDKAIKYCEGVLQIDEKHQDAGRILSEAVAKRDKIAELRRKAEIARNKGDLRSSAAAYRQLTAIIPKSQLARDGLDSARKELAGRRTKRLAVLAILLAIGGSGWFVWQDYQAVSNAERCFKNQDYPNVVVYTEKVLLPWPFAKKAKKLYNDSKIYADLALAAEAARKGDWKVAIEHQEAVLKYYREHSPEGPQIEGFEKALKGYRYRQAIALAKAAEDRGDWESARKAHSAARASVIDDESMKQQASDALDSYSYCDHLVRGLEAMKVDDSETANVQFRKALNLRPDAKLPRDKLNELGETVD